MHVSGAVVLHAPSLDCWVFFIDCHTCWLSLFHTISAVCLCALQECSGFTGVLQSVLTNSPLCSPLTLMSLWDFILKSRHFAHCSLRPAQQRALTGAAKQQWNSLTPHRKNLLFFSNFIPLSPPKCAACLALCLIFHMVYFIWKCNVSQRLIKQRSRWGG